MTVERTYFIQPQNIHIRRTDIKRNNASKTPPWKSHIPIPTSIGRGKCHNKKRTKVSMAYSEVGTPVCSLNTTFTCTTVIIMEVGKTGLMKYPLYLKTVLYFAELQPISTQVVETK